MGNTVLVTGAGSGIGRAVALTFLQRGWQVVATMRDPAKAVPAGFPMDDARLAVDRLDVSAEHEAQAVVARALARFGGVDVLVNNAAFGPMGPLETTAPEDMARIFDTNSIGPIRVAQAVLPAMRDAGRGRIINVSSMGGEFTTPFVGAYHASKFALESLSDALRFEVAPFGIQVVVVQPGPVATSLATDAVAGLFERAVGPYARPVAALAERSRAQLARGRGVLRPEDVARVVFEAATASRPRTRYRIGTVAHAMRFLRRRLSDRMWDRMWAAMLRGSEPGSVAPSARSASEPSG
ncbi:MAG: SDR family oxidoreductase [Methylobacteriaceae bacterium]|nr:SDR family oxidoreductase [Methylobacteriaceae bacterium]